MFFDENTAVSFDSFGVEYIPHNVLKKVKDAKLIGIIFRIQFYDSIMCGFSWIALTEYMRTGQSLLDYNNLFFSNGYQKMTR